MMNKEEISKEIGISEEELEKIIKFINEVVKKVKETITITFNRLKEILVQEIEKEIKRKKYMKRVRNRNKLCQKRYKKYGKF